MDKAFVSRAADAAQFTTTPTDSIRFLCAGNDDMPDIEDERLSPGDGPPLHRHPWVTWSVVIEGTFLVRLGDEDVHLGPGDLAFTPPDMAHSFMCTGTQPGRLIHVNWPGGFHRLYAEMAPLYRTDGPPDFGAMAAAAARHGAEILGPPLAVLTAGDVQP